MLLVTEACQDQQRPEVSELRQYRLDTVDDTERMPGSLQLPQSQGAGQVSRQRFAANIVPISLVGPAEPRFSRDENHWMYAAFSICQVLCRIGATAKAPASTCPGGMAASCTCKAYSADPST